MIIFCYIAASFHVNSLTSLNITSYSQTTFCVALGKVASHKTKVVLLYKIRDGHTCIPTGFVGKAISNNRKMPTHLVSINFILNLMRDRLHEKPSNKERNNKYSLIALLRYPALSVMPYVRRFTTCSVLVVQSRLGTILYYDWVSVCNLLWSQWFLILAIKMEIRSSCIGHLHYYIHNHYHIITLSHTYTMSLV